MKGKGNKESPKVMTSSLRTPTTTSRKGEGPNKKKRSNKWKREVATSGGRGVSGKVKTAKLEEGGGNWHSKTVGVDVLAILTKRVRGEKKGKKGRIPKGKKRVTKFGFGGPVQKRHEKVQGSTTGRRRVQEKRPGREGSRTGKNQRVTQWP